MQVHYALPISVLYVRKIMIVLEDQQLFVTLLILEAVSNVMTVCLIAQILLLPVSAKYATVAKTIFIAREESEPLLVQSMALLPVHVFNVKLMAIALHI